MIDWLDRMGSWDIRGVETQKEKKPMKSCSDDVRMHNLLGGQKPSVELEDSKSCE